MNWEKAKTLTIAFLLMVNAFLAAMVYSAGLKYTMTDEQDAAIRQYMSRNGISAYAAIPREFKPMAALRVQPSAYSPNDLALAFLGSDGVVPDYSGPQAVYARGGETLTVEGDSFVYENGEPQGSPAPTRAGALDACAAFLSRHESVLGKFVFDRVTEANGGYTVVYSGKFRDRLLTSNSLEFLVTGGGIARVSGVYNRPSALTGEARAIISPDEALYMFVRYMNYVYDDRDILLDGIDLVYHLAEVTTDSTIPMNATPYYRFRVFAGEAQVMINAYTGGVLDGFY